MDQNIPEIELMKSIVWLVFLIISVALVAIGGIWSGLRQRKVNQTRNVLRPMQLFTAFVFLAVWSLMIPMVYYTADFGDEIVYVRPLILAVNNAMRVFILDADFADITGGLANIWPWLHVSASVVAAVLYVLAPGLTFVNVVSIFRNILGEIWFKRCDRQACYIFSELNSRSVALAKSIRAKDRKAHLVFTDVYEQNDEPDYELLLEARELRALCMKKDITHVDLLERKGKVELFLIGGDESENVSQAVQITTELEKLNKKKDVKMCVFSRKQSGAYIIDSVRYDRLLADALERGFGEDTFKLRRINEVQQLVWHTVPEMNLFALAEQNGGKIPVLIAGMGSYGLEFFKMLVWFCQFEDYRLQLTVVDKQAAGAVQAMIDRECPELMKRNRIEEEGESFYDIEILPDIDMETAALEALLFYEGDDEEKLRMKKRLEETKVAIVGMGDDDLNIETAVHLRSLFDRVYGLTIQEPKDVLSLEEEPVQIYAVVFDEQKAGILHNSGAEESCFLRNHQNVPYHIRFIGTMSSQFHYDNVYDQTLEKAALKQHLSWAKTENKRNDLHVKFEQYEYFRRSSMATVLYDLEVMEVPPMKDRTTCTNPIKSKECRCDNCVRRMRSEHMRWNAYMRVYGYSFGKQRADRAMLHNDLQAWAKLSKKEQEKDAGEIPPEETE